MSWTSEQLSEFRAYAAENRVVDSGCAMSLIAEVERLRAELDIHMGIAASAIYHGAKRSAESPWHPMETAPKNGEFLLALKYGVTISQWCSVGQKWLFISEQLTDRESADISSATEDDQELLGWMPLPKPPEQKP